MQKRLSTGGIAALLLAAFGLNGLAGGGAIAILYSERVAPELIGTPTGVTFVTPVMYQSCPTSTLTDHLYTTGVGDRRLKGVVNVYYTTPAGWVLVPNGQHSIDQAGDLDLYVSYPPVSEWPVWPDGRTREIHVDIRIGLYEYQQAPWGTFYWVKVANLGPQQIDAEGHASSGNDWDVWCTTYTPPPEYHGCTPGFWKQIKHLGSWPAPYTRTTTFADAFGIGPAVTLIDAMTATGGTPEEIMMRQAVAALLNAKLAENGAMTYLYSVQAVKALVAQAYSDGQFEVVKDLFEAQNEIGCPLR